jgi:hypothetical protein
MNDTPMSPAGFGTGSGNDTGISSIGSRSGACPTCGHDAGHTGLEDFLGRLGISDDMINNLKSSMQNVDVEQYLNTARDYLKDGSTKATTYAKENPGKVAAGVAVLAVGAGLLISAINRD